MYKVYPHKRYKQTLKFIQKFVEKDTRILDLGVENPFSQTLQKNGYHVQNTDGFDLDLYPERLHGFDADCTTALEILEHLVNPFEVLRKIPTNHMVATIPMSLWFGKTYRNMEDVRDSHFHEFLDWQFDLLLEKAGWEIIYSEKWTNPTKKIGLRPILRMFVPRYYAVYAKRKPK